MKPSKTDIRRFRAALVLITDKYIGPVESAYDIKNAIEDYAHDSKIEELGRFDSKGNIIKNLVDGAKEVFENDEIILP